MNEDHWKLVSMASTAVMFTLLGIALAIIVLPPYVADADDESEVERLQTALNESQHDAVELREENRDLEQEKEEIIDVSNYYREKYNEAKDNGEFEYSQYDYSAFVDVEDCGDGSCDVTIRTDRLSFISSKVFVERSDSNRERGYLTAENSSIKFEDIDVGSEIVFMYDTAYEPYSDELADLTIEEGDYIHIHVHRDVECSTYRETCGF